MGRRACYNGSITLKQESVTSMKTKQLKPALVIESNNKMTLRAGAKGKGRVIARVHCNDSAQSVMAAERFIREAAQHQGFEARHEITGEIF